MNILYDYQMFCFQNAGGISRYHSDLFNGLRKKGIDTSVGIKYCNNLYLKNSGINIEPPFNWGDHFITKHYFPGKYRLAAMVSKYRKIKSSLDYNKELTRNILKNGEIDIFHPTYYSDTYDEIELPPMVLTIHDMIYESYPQYFNNIQTISGKHKLAQKAKKIIAVSQYTKQEILRHYDFIQPKDIEVIYHGIDLNENRPVVEKTNKSYLLFVGLRGGYKNFYFFLRSFKKIQKEYKNIQLVCVGPPFDNNEKIYIDFLGLKDHVICKGRVSDDELIILYSNAKAYVSSSLSEGFGIPLLEAMKYEVPLFIADIPVYREVANNAATYFNPTIEEDCYIKFAQLIDKQNILNQLNNASKRITFFSKEKMIENTYNLYKSVQ